tara:strand:+ start:562 stop:756 length:195 start_codon:yes stop_codon:yes gene_type:complete
MTNFEPHAKRHYHQFNNSNSLVLSDGGRLEKGPGTIIEVTEKGGAGTTRANYRLCKENIYNGTF